MKKLFLFASFIIMTMGADAQNVEQRVEDALGKMTLHEKIQVLHAQSKFTSAGVPRLGIRQLNMDDGPHGVREELEWNTWSPAHWTNDSVVAFPSLTCLAATWNRDLSRRYGHALSEEFAFRGKDVILGPGVNIARTPLNGRAFEYMGEDPLLAGEMVSPYIQAAQQNGVACCMKHYVLNDQETDRFGVNVNVSERALREIYLEPFRRAVDKAHVWSIMGSYNLYNGEHCCHNDILINRILKQEWQWDGALVSDWGGTTSTMQAALNGLDIEMGTYTDGKEREAAFGYNDYFLADKFETLIKEGKIPMSVLDDKVRRVLRLIYRTAMNPQKIIGSQCSEAHYEVCREIGEEGIVLLKNGPLPVDFSKYKKILVVGENGTRSLTEGGGSSELKTLKDVSPLEALRNQLSMPSSIDYAQGYYSGKPMYSKQEKLDSAKQARLHEEAVEKAKDADLIIYVGGLNKNHGQDCENGDRESYDLPFGQNELIADLAAVTSSPKRGEKKGTLIVVTFGGNAYAIPWLDTVDALVHCWYLGSESGNALVNVLTGKVNPSGKLPVTFAKRYEDYPYVKFGERAYPGIKGQVYYDEGIFVGYRGFDKNKTKVLFPFGYGLSYTTFDLKNVIVEVASLVEETLNMKQDAVEVTVNVTNTGSVAGKEVAQVYVASPNSKKKDMPVKELKAFAKTRLLQPGESETLTMTIPLDDLRYWNEQTHQWQLDKGKYTFHVGVSSTDLRTTASLNIE